MTTFRRVLVEKRWALMAVGVGTVLALGLYVFVVFPWTARVETARQRELTARQNLSAARLAHELARSRTDGKTRTVDQLQRFYAEVLPSSLAAARGITYPRFAELASRHNLILEQRSSIPEQDDESELARLRTTMLLGGAWPDIRRFIHELEADEEFIVIENVMLRESESVEASQMLSISVSTYYQPGLES